MHETMRKLFQTALTPLDRACNFVFGSKYNPLYQTGAIAIALLAVMIVTGLVLVMFYRVAFPYESMTAIEDGIYFTRWIRALHRYASDAAMVAVAIHVWRMLAEGKTWGPRLLAWVSGVFLLLAMLAVGWTGFVLVWDFHGQRLATIGARMLDAVPLFRGAILHTFSGAALIGQSFFFMNLFLHMSIPLAMIFGLWLHTSRLNRPAWFPARRYTIAIVVSLTTLACLWPAPLGGPPDLLALGGHYPLNIFYGFLIPLAAGISPAGTLAAVCALALIMMSVPLWLRPRRETEPEKSSHNQAACTGCSQCYQDCPFEAIAMVPRTAGVGSDTVASVIEDYCVGCGICSGSCSQMAIGPKSLKPKEQLRAIRELADTARSPSLLLIHCAGQESGDRFVERARAAIPGLLTYRTPCSGVLHPGTLTFALRYFRGVFVIGCEPRACRNRSGQELLELRVEGGRSPVEPGDIDHARIRIAHGSRAEFDDILDNLTELHRSLSGASGEGTSQPRRSKLARYARSALATAAISTALASLSAVNFSDRSEQAVLRVAVRLPLQVSENCHTFTDAELAKIPAHMRKAQDCDRTPIPYGAEVLVDERPLLREAVVIGGARQDRPMTIENEFALAPGEHRIRMRLSPAIENTPAAPVFETAFTSKFDANRVELITYDADTKTLRHLESKR